MRQGNGVDILGPNDPRSATIGMIYVAPNDDRGSVLAAILTQEKLGRKQIAIVLPDQNKAFQRPVDFDGLKNMRRKLQAELVIIAPSGPGPAEFARQRHFSVYSSVDSYGRSLRDAGAGQPVVEPKRGLFGRKTKLQPANGTTVQRSLAPIPMPMPSPVPTPMVLPPQPPAPNMEEEDDAGVPWQDNHGGAMAAEAGMGFMAGAGAGAMADSAMHAAEYDDETPTLVNSDDWDDLPPVFPPPSPAPMIVDSTETPAQDSMAPPPSPPFMDEEDEENEGDGFMPPPLPFPVPAPEPDIIQFPSISRRPTQDLPDADDEGPAGPVPIVPVPMSEPSNTPAGRQSSGNGGNAAAAVGAAGLSLAAAGVASTGRGVGAGSPPPTRGNAGTGSAGTPPPPRRRRRGVALLLALVALLLLTLLVCGSIALAAPNSPIGSMVSHVVGGGTPSATVTLVPASQTVSGNFAILAVTGKPNSSQREVQARELSYTTPVQSKTVNATGVHNIPATQASGYLTFYNTNAYVQTVAAGTVFSVHGVQIENSVPAVIPAGNLPSLGTVTVSARALTTGSVGNIGAGALSGSCCVSGVAVKNLSAFGGGQDPQHYTAVQQSDVDNVANPLVNPTEQSALTTLKGQRHANEQFVGQPKCTPKVNANPPVGSKSQTVTVAVSASCSGEVYDHSGAIALAVTSLQNQASKVPGTSYKLVGQVVPTVTQLAVVDNKGTISMVIKAEGIWEYNFGKTQEAQLAQKIAGKSQSAAQAILAGQEGVGKVVSITLTTGTTLPTDVTQIHFVIQDAPGLTGTPTGSGSPTTITPTTGPGTAQPGSGLKSGNGTT
ncbi:MAG TPA: baseplate J/gp47 family protein [Ktedonobacteraceae bacterium]|nr:baseplate J/gp47 family protein [Ktedonobacteraceae bacterium]